MKVAIYSPYLDTFGGGERYMMSIAELLSGVGEVDIFLDNHLNTFGKDYLKKNLEERFDLNLSKTNFTPGSISKNSRNYDLLFYLTDGSIFIPSAKKNILHIQSPLRGQPANSIWGKVKLKFWDLIIYNSEFTKENSADFWRAKSEVIYPPVDIKKIKPFKKKKYILSVGRFFGYLKDKKHTLLIETFKDLCKNKKMKDWNLNLAGAASDGDKPYLNELKSLAEGLPINFYPNISYDDLVKLYGESSIYWHAAGFGENDPTKMEHFGISTVEAMAGGAVPVVIGSGGQKEIVQNGKSGFLWNDVDALKGFTLKLVEENDTWEELSKGAIIRSKNFSKEQFNQKILDLVKN